MTVGAVCSGHGRDIAAAFGVHQSAAFVGFRAGAENFLHRFHITADSTVMGMGAGSALHSCHIAALCRMLSMMGAILLGSKGHHRSILHQHTQAQQDAQDSFQILFHIFSSSGKIQEGSPSIIYIVNGSEDLRRHVRSQSIPSQTFSLYLSMLYSNTYIT